MPHATNLITILAIGFGLALILGFCAARLRLPALIGYLLAGVAIGPATPGFVADAQLASQLAEIGVMLLMFGVGLHFSLDDLKSVRKIALPGAIVQMTVATAMGCGVAQLWGWSIGASLVFGISLSVASTVVLIKALESRHQTHTANGRIAIGWLVVEDLAMVLVLVLLPALAPLLNAENESVSLSSLDWVISLAMTLAQVGAFIAFMLIVGRRLFPRLLWHVAQTGSRELFNLCVIAAAVGIAYGAAALFGVSFALGAFFAGMVLRESEFSQRAAEQTLPLQDAFAVLFFVSVGMLFDPSILIESPLQVLATVLIVVVGKTLAAMLLVIAMRYPLHTALAVGASLAQIGEFSFILVGLGITLGLFPAEGQSLVLAAALLSIALNPLTFKTIEPAEKWLKQQPWLNTLIKRQDFRENPLSELPIDTDHRLLSRQIIIVGWGELSQRIAVLLQKKEVPFIVMHDQREEVEMLRIKGIASVWGSLIDPHVLIQAHIREAAVVLITLPDMTTISHLSEMIRKLNPSVHILLNTNNNDEAQKINEAQLGEVVVAQDALADALLSQALSYMGSK